MKTNAIALTRMSQWKSTAKGWNENVIMQMKEMASEERGRWQ